jgi:trafficking protein particle complex subunit 2
MSATQVLLFVIVGQNEPLYEAEIHKRGAAGNSDAVARQNYFVVHSALDLVEKASWTSQNVRVVQRWDTLTLFCMHQIQ